MPTAWLTDCVTTNLQRAIHYTLLWGLDGVELRTVGGDNERAPYISRKAIKRRLSEVSLDLVSVCPGLFEGRAGDRAAALNDLQILEETCDFCVDAGCPLVVVSGFAPTGPPRDSDRDTKAAIGILRVAGAIAESRGVRVAVLNEPAASAPTTEALDRLITVVAHPNVGAAWRLSPAFLSDAQFRTGGEPLLSAPAYIRLVIGSAEEYQHGELQRPFRDAVSRLTGMGYDGAITRELEGPDPVAEGLRASTSLIREIRQRKYAEAG